MNTTITRSTARPRAQWAPHTTAEFERAQRDIDTALALKPGLARAYAAQALLLQIQRPGSDAEQEALLRRALAADPNHVDAMNWLTGALAQQGRQDEAEEILQRALRLDPVAPVINANWAYREAQQGRWAEAEQRLLRMLELPQVSLNSWFVLNQLYLNGGRLVDAAQLHKRMILEIIPERGRAPGVMHLIAIYAMLGLVEQAEDWRERSIQNFPRSDMMRLYELEALSLRSGARDHGEALDEVETIIGGMAPDLADIPRDAVMFYGSLLALAGDAEGTIRVLAPLLAEGDVGRPRPSRALAWAYLQAGDPAAAAALLESLDPDYRQREAAGRLHLSDDLVDFALNTLLLGEPERALDLLTRAAEAGWRGYYAALRDPRWDSVRGRPEFQAIMDGVKADLDLQRAQLEAIDAEDDFIARYEAALALHADKVDEAEP